MEPMSTNRSSNRPSFRLRHIARSLLLSGLGAAALASCSNLGYSSDASSNQQDAYTSDPEALAAEFSFPLASCGEQATQPSGTWYVVYIDGANPDEIRRKFCKDAIGTVRDKTGAPTVQVASLTDYSKALKLATAVGGEVETTVASQSPGSSPNSSPGSPAASPGSSPAADSSSGTGYLTAADPGSSINIRQSASTTAPIAQTGRSGDQIRIAEQQQGDDGRTWFKISLPSGQEGWVRSDFVTREMASNTGSTGANSSFNSANSGSSGNGPSSGSTTTPSTQFSSPSPSGGYSASGSNNSASPSSGSYSSSDRSSPQDSASQSDRADPYSTSASAADQSPDRTSDQSSDQASASQSDRYTANQTDDQTSDSSTDSSTESSIAAGGSATLVSDNPASRINIRDDASTSSQIEHIGYAGDPVQVIDSAQGDDGYTWYQVEFESGAVGWVRGDLVNGG